jgi:dTDP-4-amino-4,6-dideoxygalactose transaminase
VSIATAVETVDFAPPDLGEREIAEVVGVLRSGWLSTGPRVQRFEQAFADYAGSPHAIALNSCTAGLHLSLVVAGIGPGDEVVTTPLTISDRTLSLPLSSGMTDDAVDRVVDVLHELLG